jgi:putative Holliday junction resolvase
MLRMSSSLPPIPPHGRILAVDPGSRRIGVALSDPDRILAQPLTTLSSFGRRRDVQALVQLAEEHDAVALVVGLPYNMDGSEGPAFAKSARLIKELEESSGLPVCGWDERLTSVQAERTLIAAGLRRDERRRKGMVDRVAAALILEAFLASLPDSRE